MFLGVLIPSTAGKVAVSMPILAPIAQLSGVTGQTTVLAFILGNGLCNMVTPTSGMLLAYIAASKVGFGEWIRFIAPLFATMLAIAVGRAGYRGRDRLLTLPCRKCLRVSSRKAWVRRLIGVSAEVIKTNSCGNSGGTAAAPDCPAGRISPSAR